MKIHRRKRPEARTTGHYMVWKEHLGAYICESPHQCGEVHDRNGRLLTLDQEMQHIHDPG